MKVLVEFSQDSLFPCSCRPMLVFSCSAGEREEAAGRPGRWVTCLPGGVGVHCLPQHPQNWSGSG